MAPATSPTRKLTMPLSPPPLPSKVDVLIIGSGPAGLTLAAQLAQLPNIHTALLEQRPTKLQKGHADGLQVRSLEMFQALGFAEHVVKEAYQVNEMTFWEPDGKDGGIYRASRAKDTPEGTSEMPHVILTQARLHEHFLRRMEESVNPIVPYYGCAFRGFAREGVVDGWNEVLVERTDEDGCKTEHEVRARYVVGCDGARSKVREALSLPMVGEPSDSVWGVMDAIADTDFPDIRVKVAMRSASEGAILIIPKAEKEHMVARIYVELGKVDPNAPESGKVTEETIAKKTQKIFKPYHFEVKEVLWWSQYVIGQRRCERFDNSTEGHAPTVFIAGDACHTHSPKAGQGMNTSMADAFNLGWKLATVLQGLSSPEILRTYSSERQLVAKELIEFDEHLTRVFSSHSSATDKNELRKAHADKAAFLAGTGIQYNTSLIQAEVDESRQGLAKGFPVGKRFHSAKVLRCADACVVHLGHALVADGRWRIVIFAGSDRPGDRGSRTWRLCEWLESSPVSPVKRYTPAGADVDSVVDVMVVYREAHSEFTLNDVPALLWPRKQKYHGARDYRKVFTSWWKDGEEMEDIYTVREVSREQGAVLVIRPDQYVANVVEVSDLDRLARFFDGFMTGKHVV